jgi:carbon monoxide dehydrogenase subunit G
MVATALATYQGGLVNMTDVSFELEIDAPREQVFRLLTTPDKIAQWMDAEDVSLAGHHGNLRVGAELDIQIKEGRQTNHYHGSVLECEEPRHLRMKLGPKNYYFDNRYDLEDSAGGTHIIYMMEGRANNWFNKMIGRLFKSYSTKIARGQMLRLKEMAETDFLRETEDAKQDQHLEGFYTQS